MKRTTTKVMVTVSTKKLFPFIICVTDIITLTKHASWRLSAFLACFGWLILIDAVVQVKTTDAWLAI